MSKTILITGASSGMGRTLAEQLLAKGYTVYGGDINYEGMADLEQKGMHRLLMDVTNSEQVDKGVSQLITDTGKIDALFNNAGYATYDLIETIDINRAKKLFEVNVWGATNLIQSVLPHMRQQRSGRIINTSSIVGRVATILGGWYAASKHAVEAISDALRQEVHQFGIKVSIIEPGSFHTGFSDVVFKQFEQINAGEDYKELVEKFVTQYKANHAKAPTPEPVTVAMIDALESENPKIRYVVGADAEGLVKAKASMSDEAFDQLVFKSFNL